MKRTIAPSDRTAAALPQWTGTRIHLINPMEDFFAGSEQRTVELFHMLRPYAKVTIWSPHPDPRMPPEIPVARLLPRRGQYPKTGVMVFIGNWYHVGRWVLLTCPRRIVIVCNIYPPDRLEPFYQRVSLGGRRRVEFVFASEDIREMTGRPGPVQASPIDLRRFHPGAAPHRGKFTVGRLSRDHKDKFHSAAPAFYEKLLTANCAVRLMGATLLRDRLPAHPDLEILPAASMPPEEFLRGLDCFCYRTSEEWFETFGRVVFEAMACGLPVVAHRHAGYSRFLSHGDDAFLFDEDDEALHWIARLRDDPELRARIGGNARRTVERLYSVENLNRMIGFYLA